MKRLIIILLVCVIALSLYACKEKPAAQEKFVSPTRTDETDITNNMYYNITDSEREMLARIVTCEASICSLECQKAVCSVIFNRLEAKKWGNNLEEVIFYPNAFSPILNGSYDRCNSPSASAYAAVDYVVKNGPTVPTYVRYFRSDKDFNWEDYKNYIVIDNMYFGYFENWESGQW